MCRNCDLHLAHFLFFGKTTEMHPPASVTSPDSYRWAWGWGWVGIWGRVGHPNGPMKPSSAINLSTWAPRHLILTAPGDDNTCVHTQTAFASCFISAGQIPAFTFLYCWWMGFNKSWQSDEIKSASHGLRLLQLLYYRTYFNILLLKLQTSVLHHCCADIAGLIITWLDCCC